MLKRQLIVAAALLLPAVLSSTAAALAEAGELKSVALTVYNGDLALIREVRELNLSAGLQNIVLSEVSGRLRPDTVHLSVPGFEVLLMEQNYDYDLVDLNKLMQRFIGENIKLVNDSNNSSVIEGRLLSVDGGIVLDSGGRILLDPPGRVVLPASSADGLLLRPTLSWMLQSNAAGSADAEISYLSGGLSWEADYVLLLNEDDSAGDFSGMVTLSNYSGTTYENAKLKLVAGDVNVVPEYDEDKTADIFLDQAYVKYSPDWAGFYAEEFFEYHLYDLQRPATILNNQQKQIDLLSAESVPLRKVYEFDSINGGDVRVEVEFTNDEESGMGMALPAGEVSVYKKDSSGSSQFLRKDHIDHTARKEDLRVFVGNAFDVAGETTRTAYRDLPNGGQQGSYRIRLRNHKRNGEGVTVIVPVRFWGEWNITAASHPYEMKDAWASEFSIDVPAGEERELIFNYEVKGAK